MTTRFDKLNAIVFQNLINDDGTFPSVRKIGLPITMFYRTHRDGQSQAEVAYPGGIHRIADLAKDDMHQHEQFELLYVLEGEVTHQIEQATFQYKKGDACLLNKNIRHREIPGAHCRVVFVNMAESYIRDVFENDLVYDETGNLIAPDGPIHQFIKSNILGEERFDRNYLEFTPNWSRLSEPDSDSCPVLLEQMRREMVDQQPGNAFIVKGLLSRLIHELEDDTRYHANFMRLDAGAEDFLFARIVNYLKDSNGRITRTELSNILNYNAEYLNQIVKKRTGMSLMRLGKFYCIDKAKDLLCNTDKSISEIVEALGFVSSSHFYDLFQKTTGMSPNTYRSQQAKSIH